MKPEKTIKGKLLQPLMTDKPAYILFPNGNGMITSPVVSLKYDTHNPELVRIETRNTVYHFYCHGEHTGTWSPIAANPEVTTRII